MKPSEITLISADSPLWQRLGIVSSYPSVLWCEWPDRSGYYEPMEDGRFLCTVGNQSEIFATPEAAQAFLYANVGEF